MRKVSTTSFFLTAAFIFGVHSVSAQAMEDPTDNWVKPVKSEQQDAPSKALNGKAVQTTIVTETGLQAEPGLYEKPCVCQAKTAPGQSEPGKKKKFPVLKGIGKEFSMEMGDLGKDVFMAFSVSGKDPYEMPEHPNVPYVRASAQLVDGSSVQMWKYPDGSLRAVGGFCDGTFACLQQDGLYIVQYPNGARGTLKISGEGGELIRPDNTVTKFSRAGQAMRITNSKLGYMGDLNPDTTGLSYEFAKQNF